MLPQLKLSLLIQYTFFMYWYRHSLITNMPCPKLDCRQTSNISRTFVDNQLVDHSDGVGASPAGAAPTPSTFSI